MPRTLLAMSSFDFTTQPSNGETITVAGVTGEFVEGANPSASEIRIHGTSEEIAQNVCDWINRETFVRAERDGATVNYGLIETDSPAISAEVEHI